MQLINFVLTWTYALYFFGCGALLYLVTAMIRLLTFWFDPDGRIVHAFTGMCCFNFVRTNPFWKRQFEGAEYIDPTKTYILIANHNSVFDILVLYGLRRQFKWVSKEEMFKVPVIGWTLRINQYISIRRRDATSAQDMLSACKHWLSRNVSVAIFPEGARSMDGGLQQFRYGAFRLAKETGIPIVPIVVDGTRVILPRNSLSIGFKTNIRVQVLPPVSPDEFADDNALRAHIESLYHTTLANMRNNLAYQSQNSSEPMRTFSDRQQA